MKAGLKRITIIAVCIICVVLPLKILFERETDLIGGSVLTSSGGMEVSGKVVYYRGGTGPRAIVVGTADYSKSTEERSYSSERVLAGIKSGEIPHGQISWRIDWIGLGGLVIGSWLVAGLFYWWRNQDEPHQLEQSTNSEQGVEPDARHAPE